MGTARARAAAAPRMGGPAPATPGTGRRRDRQTPGDHRQHRARSHLPAARSTWGQHTRRAAATYSLGAMSARATASPGRGPGPPLARDDRRAQRGGRCRAHPARCASRPSRPHRLIYPRARACLSICRHLPRSNRFFCHLKEESWGSIRAGTVGTFHRSDSPVRHSALQKRDTASVSLEKRVEPQRHRRAAEGIGASATLLSMQATRSRTVEGDHHHEHIRRTTTPPGLGQL
jgi:hypothetical protein